MRFQSHEPTIAELDHLVFFNLLLLKDFFMCTMFSVLIELGTILLLFYMFWPGGLWDLSSLSRDGTHTPCIGWLKS